MYNFERPGSTLRRGTQFEFTKIKNDHGQIIFVYNIKKQI